jgi:hypothetical protein
MYNNILSNYYYILCLINIMNQLIIYIMKCSLNQYNYKNMDDVLPVYQQYQNLYHFTRQINPISLSNVSPQSRDPSNLPCDMRITLYDGIDGVYGHNSMNDINHIQTRQNNPNNWLDNIQPKQGYYNQNEHTLNNKRPISSIQAGQASSNQDINGYLLF